MSQHSAKAADLHNPQVEQMAGEGMARILAAQTRAIWPQEQAFLQGSPRRILDVGCGTGQFSARLGRRFPEAQVWGLDLLGGHLARAEAERGGPRFAYLRGDAYALPCATESCDLVTCRHMLQTVPDPQAVLAELVRVTRPGGRIHALAEDYAQIRVASETHDLDAFFQQGPRALGAATGTDLYCGRRVPGWLAALGVEDLRVDYVVLDPLRVSREDLSEVFAAWSESYVEALAELMGRPPAWVQGHFDAIQSCLEDPLGYLVWQIPIVSGVKGSSSGA